MEGHFGGKAIELSGIVVHPSTQAHNLGTLMLQSYMNANNRGILTAHTRNPAILKMFRNVYGEKAVYPLHKSPSGEAEALEIPGSTLENDGTSNGTVYHVNRYGDGGLYGGADPADKRFDGEQTLKEQYPGLEHPGTALVVIADNRKEIGEC